MLLLLGCFLVSPREVDALLDALPDPLHARQPLPPYTQASETTPILVSGGGFTEDTTLSLDQTVLTISDWEETEINAIIPPLDLETTPTLTQITLSRAFDNTSISLPFLAFSPQPDQTTLALIVEATPTELTATLVMGVLDTQGSLAPENGCETGFTRTSLSPAPLGAGTARLTQPQSGLEFELTGTDFLSHSSQSTTTEGSFDLTFAFEGWPDLGIPQAASLPPTPALLSAQWLGEGLALQWDSGDESTFILIEVGDVTCRVSDTGSYLVGAEWLRDLSEPTLRLGRVVEINQELPWDSSNMVSYSVRWGQFQ